MPSIGAVTEMASESTNRSLFDYVQKELIPALREGDNTELAEKLERLSQPRKVEGLGRRILTSLRHATYCSELEDRKNYFLRQIYSLSPEEKNIVNKHARDHLEGPYISRIKKWALPGSKKGQKAVAMSAVITASNF